MAMRLLLIPAVLLTCGCVRLQTVKVPVPVPCIQAMPVPDSVPLETMSAQEAVALAKAGQWAVLADRVGASLRLLAAENRSLRASLQECSELPAH